MASSHDGYFCLISAASDDDDYLNEIVDSAEDLSNLNDYYDPEDLTGTTTTESAVLKEKLISEKILRFRNSGCRKNSRLFREIPLFTASPKKLARLFLSLGTVYSTGSSEYSG